MSRQLRRCRLSRCRNPPTSMSRLGRSDWISYIVHGEGIVATDPGPIMNLSLPAEIQRLIEDRVRSGKYPTPEDVVAAAIATLDQQDRFGDFAPGELDALMAAGERDIERGDVMDADQGFAELRRLSDQR